MNADRAAQQDGLLRIGFGRFANVGKLPHAAQSRSPDQIKAVNRRLAMACCFLDLLTAVA